MSVPIETAIPEKISLGETVKWQEEHSDFKAGDGWALKYYFANATASSKFEVAAIAYLTNSFLTTLNPTVFASASAGAGTYRYEAHVTKGAETVRVSYGEVELLADLTAAGTTDLTYKTPARQIFEAVEATILGRASSDQLEMQIRDRKIKRYSADELKAWYTFFKNIVKQEEAAENLEQGKGSGNTIKARFVSD